MCIIQLDRTLIRKFLPALILLEEPPDDITERSLHKEVLLLEAQFLAQVCIVVRVKDVGDTLGFTSFMDSFDIIGVVEF